MSDPAAPPRGRLARKYALLFIALVGAALVVNSAFDFWLSYQENKASLVLIQREKADAAAQRIEEFIGEIERQIGWTTHAQWAAAPLDQRRFDYVRLLRQVPAITELSELDKDGREQLKVSRLSMDVVGSEADLSQSPAFLGAKAHGTWFSPVYFRKQSEPYLTLAVARAGRNAGVTVAEINLKLISDVITGLRIGKGGYAYLVDGAGKLIAHPDISLVLRDTDLSSLPQVAAALSATPQASPIADNIAGKPVLTAHAAVAPVGWWVFVEVPLSEAFAPLYGAALRSLGLLAAGLVIAALAAFFLARRMTGPIRTLREGAARIGAGELGRRIEIHTGDELEGLAGQFNSMAADLQKSYAELERRVEERTAELAEALEQQTATAEILQVINASPGDLTPVFEAILEKAHTLCDAPQGSMFLRDGDSFRAVVTRGIPEAFAARLRQGVDADSPVLKPLIAGERVVHIPDMAEIDHPMARVALELAVAHSVLAVPLRKGDTLFGMIVAARFEVRPFTEKQIVLLENFAAQAVIAIENARLITETREALEQQTATAEILRVINESPGDLPPVFGAMLEKATRLCGARCGQLAIYDGDMFSFVAAHGEAHFARGLQTEPHPPSDGVTWLRILDGEDVVHVPDVRDTELYRSGHRRTREFVETGRGRTLVSVALRKEDVLLGVLSLYRQEVRPFSDKEIALLQNFAAQAVIAIENARLITETREALEQQTATAEVLGVINSSPGDLVPVFDAILEKAHSLCGADFGGLLTYDGESFRAAALRGVPAAFAAVARQPFRLGPRNHLNRLIRGEALIHIADLAETAALAPDDQMIRAAVERGGIRTLLAVPLRKDDRLLGIITAYRQEVRPFSDKQIALLQNFAAQAVIAMENARLLGELRESTAELARSVEELQALAEVGRAVSSTLDLQQVLGTILARSVDLSGADAGAIFRYSPAGLAYHLVEARGWDARLVRAVRELHIDGAATGMGEAAARREPLQFADLAERPSYPLRDLTLAAGFRSVLIVPLIGAERVFGAIVLERRITGEFPAATVRLMQTIASQSALAIQNAGLFREIADKSEALALASQHKSQFLANMSHELRTPLNAILGYAELMADGLYGELPERAAEVLERVQNNGRHLLALINDVLDLSKIEAGQLTLSLEDYALGEIVQSVVAAAEPLATTKGLKFTAETAPGLPRGHGDPRRIAQVLLNLAGNAIKFTDAGEVAIRAEAENGRFIVTVRDTGPGIAPEDHAKIFDEFQQVDNSSTRKKGGTGLGLAISKRMVEMQGGTLTVDSELGAGATFRVTLPIRVAAAEELLLEASQ